MRTLIPLLLATWCVTGCNTIKQSATVRTTDPKTGVIEERTVESQVSTRGDAKAAVEKMAGGATSKSAHIGASGVSEESNVTDTIKAITDGLAQIISAAAAAGAKAATK